MKGRVLIIGAGGVGTVVAQKVAMNRDIFTDITIASRTKSTIDALVAKIPGERTSSRLLRSMPMTWSSSACLSSAYSPSW